MDEIFNKLQDFQKKPKKNKEIPVNFSRILNEKANNTITREILERNLFPNAEVGLGSEILKEIASNPTVFEEKIKDGNFLLEKFQKGLKTKPENGKRERIFAKQLEKQLKFFKIPATYAKYSLYEPMNRLWRQYIATLTENSKANEEQMLEKLLKADLHGAIISVLAAKCESYEGISGIILKESKNSLKIVTRNDKILTILKENCVFLLDFPGKPVKIFGKQLCYRPADRLKAAPKIKKPAEFILKTIEI